jgi:hypothetical protein
LLDEFHGARVVYYLETVRRSQGRKARTARSILSTLVDFSQPCASPAGRSEAVAGDMAWSADCCLAGWVASVIRPWFALLLRAGKEAYARTDFRRSHNLFAVSWRIGRSRQIVQE